MKHKLQNLLKHKLQWLLLLAALLGVSQGVWGVDNIRLTGNFTANGVSPGWSNTSSLTFANATGNWYYGTFNVTNGGDAKVVEYNNWDWSYGNGSGNYSLSTGDFTIYANGGCSNGGCTLCVVNTSKKYTGGSTLYLDARSYSSYISGKTIKCYLYGDDNCSSDYYIETIDFSATGTTNILSLSMPSYPVSSIKIEQYSGGSYTNSITIKNVSSGNAISVTSNTEASMTTYTPCTPPSGGTATAADSPIDYKTTTTISVSGYTSGATIADWEKSTTSASSGFSSLGSTANPLTTESLTGTTYYRAKITKNGCSSYSSVATVNVNDPRTTISVDVSAVSWTDVHIYYWSGGDAWPGKNMTSIGGNIYTYEIEGSITGFIINNNGSGDKQTVDVTDITLGETNCYTVNTETQDSKRTVTKGDCPSEFTSVTVNDASVCAGSTVTLTKSSTPSESVTWSFSSSDASVATVNSDGVVIGKAAGSVTITATASKTGYISKSATCTVTVNANPSTPSITSYDEYVCSGAAPTFNVNSVDGMTYQMYVSGSPSGSPVDGDGSEITVTASNINSSTTFAMRATNAAGCYTSSDNATVTVVAGVPTIATSGAGTAVTESGDLCDGSEITLTAPTAFTNSPTQYQWSINGGAYTSLSANNTKAYTISGTSDFTVNVKAANVCGTSDASPTTTFSSIGTKASIIGQPTNQTVCQNGISSGLSVMASGTNPTYQWYSYTSSEGAGESLIAGAENSSYTPTTTTAGTYYYACKVNACGSYTVRSNIVTFTVTESHVIWLKGSGAKSASATYPWEYMTVEVDRGSGKTTPSDLTVEFIETPDFSGGVAPNHSVTITDDNKYLLKSAKTVNDAHYYTVKAQDVSGGTCAASDASYNVYINSAPAEKCGE